MVDMSIGGRSANGKWAVARTRRVGLKSTSFAGRFPGHAGVKANVCLTIASGRTSGTHETHMTGGRIMCGAVERQLFGESQT